MKPGPPSVNINLMPLPSSSPPLSRRVQESLSSGWYLSPCLATLLINRTQPSGLRFSLLAIVPSITLSRHLLQRFIPSKLKDPVQQVPQSQTVVFLASRSGTYLPDGNITTGAGGHHLRQSRRIPNKDADLGESAGLHSPPPHDIKVISQNDWGSFNSKTIGNLIEISLDKPLHRRKPTAWDHW